MAESLACPSCEAVLTLDFWKDYGDTGGVHCYRCKKSYHLEYDEYFAKEAGYEKALLRAEPVDE